MLDISHSHRISAAPMMGYSDRFLRRWLRALFPNWTFYTEMWVDQKVLHVSEQTLRQEHDDPYLVWQLAGSNPRDLYLACTRLKNIGVRYINLNAGCPSLRVKQKCMGAALFLQPDTLLSCIQAMAEGLQQKISIKTRIGVDHHDEKHLFSLVDTIHQTGTSSEWILHARKAWLNGLNPKQNRTVPPLQPEIVYQLQRCYPDIPLVYNGELKSLEDVAEKLQHFSGVMIGRGLIESPNKWLKLGHIQDKVSHYVHLTYLDWKYHRLPPHFALRHLAPWLKGHHRAVKARQYLHRLMHQESMWSDATSFQALADYWSENTI